MKESPNLLGLKIMTFQKNAKKITYARSEWTLGPISKYVKKKAENEVSRLCDA